ncbi:ATP-binding protein [Xanthobacter agilis]|uniref:ATP-binding protein n=1 Tax=Xanthobacter agilis TaxID=47492 RepID=UPI00372AE914
MSAQDKSATTQVAGAVPVSAAGPLAPSLAHPVAHPLARPLAHVRGEGWRLLLLAAVVVAGAGGVALGLLDPLLGLIMGVLLGGAMVWRVPGPAPIVVAPAAPVPERDDGKVAAVVSALPEPALLLTPEGEIVIANARVGLAIGPARVGDPLSFLVRVPEVLDAVRAAATDGLPRRVEFAERVPLDRWLEAHVVPLHLDAATWKQPGASPDAVLLTFRDLTQQRRVEQMRADFVANASHELRTPLASLSGFIETLQGPARNDVAARERFLSIMAAQARRMSRLIDDLLSLSRIELNAHVQPETEVELSAIVTHVCDTLTPLAAERSVELELGRETADLPVRGDRDELIRLFENLVENALKYGAGGKQVRVTLSREPGPRGPVGVVSVRDFGPGIAPEHLPRLTERFYRVDVAASRDQGGTGLGLAIVKHIVARHRGRLGVESTLGAGATFSVRLDLSSGN